MGSSPKLASDDEDVRFEHSDWWCGDLDTLPPAADPAPTPDADTALGLLLLLPLPNEPSTLPAKMSDRFEKAERGLLPATTTREPVG